MELRHLRYFIVIAEEQNFHSAAKRLNIAQSALSRRVKDLEAELGVALFERARKRIRLTPAGEHFAIYSRASLSDLDEAIERTRRIAGGLEGSLRLGFQPTSIRQNIVPESFRLFRERYPSIELQLVPMTWQQQLKELEQRTLDAGYCHIGNEPTDWCEKLVVGREDWLLAMPSFHRFARKRFVKLGDLHGENFVWFPRAASPLLYDEILHACASGGLSPNFVQLVASEATQLSLVAAGMGVTFASTALSAQSMANVVMRPIQDFSVPVDISLVWRHGVVSRPLAGLIEIARSLVMKANRSAASRSRR